jgi:hypothetical protein
VRETPFRRTLGAGKTVVKEETMSKNVTKARRAISAALDGAFKRALEQEQAEGGMLLDIRSAKFVIFSDHHKGSRDGADDFGF